MRLPCTAYPQADPFSDIETSPIRNFGEVSNALLMAIEAKFEPLADDGTAHAINYLTLGDAADSAPRPLRGGAHNSAARQSHAITTAQIANLRAAERHAAQIGLPFNRMITIHWEAAGVPLEGMARATGRFIDMMSKTLARHGSKIAWLWVHENGEGKGGHCHLLAHIPADLVPTITKLQRGWLRRITGKPYRARVIKSIPIGGHLGLEKSNPQLLAVNRKAALSYVTKCASDEAITAFDLDRREEGGLIIGKRCGVSQNIGAKARS